MLLHRLPQNSLRVVRPLVARSNATLSTPPPSTSATPPPPPATSSAASTSAEGGRRKRFPTRRPNISPASPREWNAPLAKGVVPAYDLALRYIQQDSVNVRTEASELQQRIDAKESEYQELLKAQGAESEAVQALDEELEAMREKLHILNVQGEVNLPDVRWKVANGLANTESAAQRHLLEHKWRKDGDLDLLMERVYQMKVVPDVLPVIRPTVDLRVVIKAKSDTTRKPLVGNKHFIFNVEPGQYLEPRDTVPPPRLYANVFHTDTRLYTLLLVDPDVPDPSSGTFSTYLHWLQPNIPLSASSPKQLSDLLNHTTYIPPHPQRGTPYHRYTVLLLPQSPLGGGKYTRNREARAKEGEVTSERIEVPVFGKDERSHFDVRAFCKQWGLGRSGGIHMFREVWGPSTSGVYSKVLDEPEPVFGRPPKADKYAAIRNKKKYIS